MICQIFIKSWHFWSTFLIQWPTSESIHYWFPLVAALYSDLYFELCMVKTKMLLQVSLNKILHHYNDLNTFQWTETKFLADGNKKQNNRSAFKTKEKPCLDSAAVTGWERFQLHSLDCCYLFRQATVFNYWYSKFC